ncbi:MAG: glycosyltransferase family 4 protein [Nitrospiraceae bacterium]|nr:glycosyltransferase family 4 protein [Nitrospiraceae bacterium]
MRIALIDTSHIHYSVEIVNSLAVQNELLYVVSSTAAEEKLGTDWKKFLNPAVTVLDFHHRGFKKTGTYLELAGLFRRIYRFGPDVIHVQSVEDYSSTIFQFLLKRFPTVLTIHDPGYHAGEEGRYRKDHTYMRDLGRKLADQIIVHGEALKKELVSSAGFDIARIHVVPHPALWTAARRAISDSHPEDEKILLFFGRIFEYKGLRYMLEAFPLITARVPDARLVIAGRGKDLDPYRETIKEDSRIMLIEGHVSPDEVSRLFSRASVVVLPYIEATQSGVVALAYAAGKPVIATKVGALPEAVDDGETGYLIEPRDTDGIARASVILLSDAALRRDMGRAAFQKAATRLSGDAIARGTLKAYESAINVRACA